jgi:hypothetical protein
MKTDINLVETSDPTSDTEQYTLYATITEDNGTPIKNTPELPTIFRVVGRISRMESETYMADIKRYTIDKMRNDLSHTIDQILKNLRK